MRFSGGMISIYRAHGTPFPRDSRTSRVQGAEQESSTWTLDARLPLQQPQKRRWQPNRPAHRPQRELGMCPKCKDSHIAGSLVSGLSQGRGHDWVGQPCMYVGKGQPVGFADKMQHPCSHPTHPSSLSRFLAAKLFAWMAS